MREVLGDGNRSMILLVTKSRKKTDYSQGSRLDRYDLDREREYVKC